VPPPATPANPSGWNGAQVLEASLALNSTSPVVAMDSTGNVFSFWQKELTTSTGAVWGNTYLASASTWKTDLAFGTQTGINQDVQVAGDGSGNYLVAWDETADSKTYSVYVNTDSVAGPGAAPTLLSAGNSFQPWTTLSANGSACVAWTTKGPSYIAVWASLYQPGTRTWSAPAQISTTTTADALWPRVAMDSAGNAVLLWAEGVYAASGPYALKAATYQPATGWSAPVAASGTQADTNFTLAMTDAGAMAAWAETTDSGATYQVRATRWTATAGWTAVAAVSAAGGAAVLPTLALDASGNALLVWTTGATNVLAPLNLLYATFTPAGGWQSQATLLTGTDGVEMPILAMNAAGSAVLAFRQWDSSVWRTSAANYAPGTGWATPVYIQTSTGGNADAPSVAINAGGQAMVVWDQLDGAGLHHIYGNRYQ
jgi:hypothetical protein